jgi:HPt (histidine-containing phosphotransfer) domain-containing protein
VLELWIPKGKQIPKTEAAQNVAAADGGSVVVDINIEGVDVKKGIAIMGGRLENYLQTLAVFSREGREKIGGIKKALESNDLQLYATYVHGFKSAAANIGAGAVSNAAQDLEAAAKAGDRAYVDARNAEFLSSLTLLISNIDNYLKTANAKNKTADNDIDIKTIKGDLVKLKTSIEYMDVGAINKTVNKLKQLTGGAGTGLVIDNILRDTLIGEYDDAVLLIDKLLAEGGNGNV